MVLLTLEAVARRRDAEHNARAWLAWNTAALSRLPPRRFPPLHKLQIRRRRPKQPQTVEQQLAVAQLITAAHSSRKAKK